MELLFRNPFHKYKDMVLNKIYSPTSRHTDPLLEQPDHSSVLFPRLVHWLCYPTTGTMRVPFRQIAAKLLKERSSLQRMFLMLKATFRLDVIGTVVVMITKTLKLDNFWRISNMINDLSIFLLFVHLSVRIVEQAKVLGKTVNLENVKIKTSVSPDISR